MNKKQPSVPEIFRFTVGILQNMNNIPYFLFLGQILFEILYSFFKKK